MNIKRIVGGFILSLVFLVFSLYVIAGIRWIFYNSLENQHQEIFLASISNEPEKFVPSQPEFNAKSAIVVESNLQDINKILFEKDSDAQLPIASLTKLMTAVVVLDNDGLFNLIAIDELADAQDPMKQDVKLGDKLPADVLLKIMIIGSSNKAAYALSEGDQGEDGVQKFVGLMNKKAGNLGLENTFFADPTGLSPQNVSTAREISIIAEYILKNYPQIAEISRVKELHVPGIGIFSNTDQLLNEIPDAICSKTGYTNDAKGCLLLAIKNPQSDHYLINVILGADDRFAEMRKLINWSDAICN